MVLITINHSKGCKPLTDSVFNAMKAHPVHKVLVVSDRVNLLTLSMDILTDYRRMGKDTNGATSKAVNGLLSRLIVREWDSFESSLALQDYINRNSVCAVVLDEHVRGSVSGRESRRSKKCS